MHAYVLTKCARPDGSFDSYSSHEVQFKLCAIPKTGYTVTGFGVAVPTQYKILWQGRWHRVKALHPDPHYAPKFFIGRTFGPTLTVRFSE